MLQAAEAGDRPDVARVHFFAGAVSNWHRHPGGQHLLLLEGRGRFGLPDAEHELAPGAFLVTPAGERHFHGAAAGSDCVWLTITWGVTEWEDMAPEPA
jgi:quercetin dioxygenase-like cupin family protein